MKISQLKHYTLEREIAPGVTVVIVLCSACRAPLYVALSRPALFNRPLCRECARSVVATVYERADRLFGKAARLGDRRAELTPERNAEIAAAIDELLRELWNTETRKMDTDQRHGNDQQRSEKAA
jgi:recombinational DNA repair protein (RecF pathway)